MCDNLRAVKVLINKKLFVEDDIVDNLFKTTLNSDLKH